MAERPSPYRPWYGNLPANSDAFVSDKDFEKQAKQKKEEADKRMNDSLAQLHTDIELAISQQNSEREASPMERAVTDAIMAAISRDHIPSKRQRYLASLGWEEDGKDGTRRIKQKPEPAPDALGITWPQLVEEDDEEEDAWEDPWYTEGS